MEALAREHGEVKLRRIDIGRWDSAVAAQYGIRQLPTLWLYEHGELLAKDRDHVAARLSALR